jgi:hypothetical protein
MSSIADQLVTYRSALAEATERGDKAVARKIDEQIKELQEFGFIGEVLATSVSVTDPAYTWRAIGSNWAATVREELAEHGIESIGRYGAWHFQGMGASFMPQ